MLAGPSTPWLGVEQPVKMRTSEQASNVRRMSISVPQTGSKLRLKLPKPGDIRQAISIFLAILLIVIIGICAVRLPWGMLVLTVVLCAFMSLMFTFGQRFEAQMNSLGKQLWLLALTAIWVVMMPIAPISIYLVIPLSFLYLSVLDDARGVVGVIGATLVAIFSQWPVFTPGGIIGPGIMALVIICIDYAYKAAYRLADERQQLIDELIETREQLLETEREAGVAQERQRIAHEIHDTLAQGLSSIQMLLHVATSEVKTGQAEQALGHIDLARQTAADNLGEARAMIAALQPAALKQTSLEQAIIRVGQNMLGTNVKVHVEGEVRQLPMKTEAALLRLAQGALGNVQKHAKAANCHVTLTYDSTEVRLDVVDDGVGFDPRTIAARPAGLGHIGLDAMRERAAEQEGTLTVESAPGQGTAIAVVLPVGTAAPKGKGKHDPSAAG